MLPLKLPSADFRPARYCPGGVGNWSGHLPFACDLMTELRPELVVELGTYYGESYFGMCQAISDAGVSCAAYAIDTWTGDEHTGAYGEDVFQEVAEHNNAHYACFSHLLRMTFDEAAERFQPDSIDVLHMDGAHTYDAVRHDFETWIGKVKPGGIVIIHDITVRDETFGAWQYWAEIEKGYPTFAFGHSNGLGVVRKRGSAAPGNFLNLLFKAGQSEQDAVRSYYELCADRLQYRFESDRRARAVSRLTPQLYWRKEGQNFDESRSVKRRITAGRETVRLSLQIPPIDDACEIRLDLAERPVALRVSNLRIVAADGREVWVLRDLHQASAASAMELLPVGDLTFVVLIQNAGAALLLPLDTSVTTTLAAAGLLTADLTVLEPFDCIAGLINGSIFGPESHVGPRLSRGFTSPALEQQKEDIRKLREGLAYAEKLAFERQENLERYDQALGEAQRIVATQAAEIERLRRSPRWRFPK